MRVVTRARLSTKPGLANKPMVPTAPTSLNRYPLPSRRRHIGQPMGGFGATDDRIRLSGEVWVSVVCTRTECGRLAADRSSVMELDMSQIEEAALGLDARSRASLAEKLLRSLENLGEDEADALWASEAEHRDAEMDQNEDHGRLAEDVLRDVRARVR